MIRRRESKRRVVARGWEQGEGSELQFTGHEVSVMQDEKVLEMGCTALCLHFKNKGWISHFYHNNFKKE